MAISQSNIINLGGDKLNINTTTAKGLEKAIGVIAQFIIKSQQGVNKLVYGDVKKKFKNKSNNKGDVSSAMNNGLLSVVDTVASVDICNIVNYLINQIPGGKGFDPNVPPRTNDPIGRSKYALQKIAYDVQIKIDEYSNLYIDPNNLQSRVDLSNLISQITESLNSISDPVTQIGLTNPQLQKAFPDISILSNFIQNAVGKFNQYTDINQINSSEIQKILKLIQDVRNVCIAIQGLNSPAAAINFLDSTFDVGIQDQIQKIQKLINPARLIPLIKSILRTANNINSIGRKIVGYIKTAQVIIQLIFLIRTVLLAVDKFLKFLQIPSIFTTLGATLALTEVQQQTIKNALEKLFQRLGQINSVLNLMVIFVENLIIVINEIIVKLRIILLNLEQCSNIDPELAQDARNTIDALLQTQNDLQTFINNYNTNKNLINTRFGNYNIEIVTEQVTDEGINLKRRFGIARGTDNIIVVQSTPTFASLDQIIINEVKVLLVSGGFVKSSLQGLSPDEISVTLESAQFLEDGSFDPDTLSINPSDNIQISEEDSQELGLQSFVNNLPGGKKLRKSMRKQMIKSNEQLVKDLKSGDPNSKYSEKIIKEKQIETAKLKIENLLEERKKLKALLLIPNPVGYAVILSRISDIDKQINSLRKEFNIPASKAIINPNGTNN
jgi:predicted DNA binding CopG/RHH family protein